MGFLKKGLTESVNLDGFISPYVCIFTIISRIRPVKKFQPILSWSKVWETSQELALLFIHLFFPASWVRELREKFKKKQNKLVSILFDMNVI